MTLTYRSTAGRRLTVTEGDNNIYELSQSSGISFLQSGTGAIAEVVQTTLRRWKWVEQFGVNTSNSAAVNDAAIAIALSNGTHLKFGTGTYNFSASSVLALAADGQVVMGDGPELTIINYSGSAAILKIPDGIHAGGFRNLTVVLGSSATAIGLLVGGEAASAGMFRNLCSNLRIRAASIVAGQIGVHVEYTSGSNGPWFNDFDNIRIQGVDKPIIVSATANQNRFSNIGIEEFGSGADGYGIDCSGSNNIFLGVTFSRGGSAATTLHGFRLQGTAGYNVCVGSADLGTGELYNIGASAEANVVIGADASSGGGGTVGNANNFVWPGPGTGLSVPKIRTQGGNLVLTSSGGAIEIFAANLLSTSGGIGYGTGAGGTVTQGAGSGKATGVTLSKITGEITMDGAILNADTTVSFTLTNTTIAAGDHVVIQHVSGGTVGSYLCTAVAAAGSAAVYVRNITAGNLTEAPVLKFSVIKAVTA